MASIAKVISKRSFQCPTVEDLGKFLPKAFKLARTAGPDPVHIDVPYDLWIRTAASTAAPGGEIIFIYPAEGLSTLLGGFSTRFGAVSVLRKFYEDTPEDAYLMQYRYSAAATAAAEPQPTRLAG